MSSIQRPSHGQDNRAPSAAGRRLGETKAEAKKKDAATAAATSTAKKEGASSTTSASTTPGALPAKTGDTLDRGPKRTSTGTMQISTLETNASLKPAREKAVDGSGNLRRNPDPATSATTLPTTTGATSKTAATTTSTPTSTSAPRAPSQTSTQPSVTSTTSVPTSTAVSSAATSTAASTAASTASTTPSKTGTPSTTQAPPQSTTSAASATPAPKPTSAAPTSTSPASSTTPPPASPTAQKTSAPIEKPGSTPAKVESPSSPSTAKTPVEGAKAVSQPAVRADAPRAGAEKPSSGVTDAKTSTTATAQQTTQAQTSQVQASQGRPQSQDPTPKTTTAPTGSSSASTSAATPAGQAGPTQRNAPIVGGRKNEAVENVRLAAAGDATQKGSAQGTASPSAQKTSATSDGGTRPSMSGVSTTPGSTTPGSPTSTTTGRGAVTTGAPSVPGAVRSSSTTTMPAVQPGPAGRTTTTTPAAPSKGKTNAGVVVTAPSGRQIKIESKKAVETVKTRAVVERTVHTQRQENVVAVQQTATVAKTVTETVHKATVQTAVRVAETHVATQVVTTTVQHQQNKAGSQKVELKADVASSDMAATQQASVVEAERLSTSPGGVAAPFKGDGTLARSSAPDIHLDPASDKELEALSQGLSRIDVVESARAFAETEHGFDLGPVSRAQRESDIQDAFFRETQASTVSLGSHAAPPFSNVSVALDRKLEFTIELSREERAQMKSQGAPYANADDGAIALSLGGAKAIEEMSAVLSLDLGGEVSDLGDSMRTLMDSDGGGDDGGDGGGGDDSGGGGDSGGGE